MESLKSLFFTTEGKGTQRINYFSFEKTEKRYLIHSTKIIDYHALRPLHNLFIFPFSSIDHTLKKAVIQR